MKALICAILLGICSVGFSQTYDKNAEQLRANYAKTHRGDYFTCRAAARRHVILDYLANKGETWDSVRVDLERQRQGAVWKRLGFMCVFFMQENVDGQVKDGLKQRIYTIIDLEN